MPTDTITPPRPRLGIQPGYEVPLSYWGFRIVRKNGCIYAIPNFVDPEEARDPLDLVFHPATLSAPTWSLLESAIRNFDPGPQMPRLLGEYEGHQLVEQRGTVYAIPESAGVVDVGDEEERLRIAALKGPTRAAVEDQIRALRGAHDVEFAGWLPVFETTANCGKHPQFAHIGEPPPGYRFRRSSPRRIPKVSAWDRLATISLAVALKVWWLFAFVPFLVLAGPRVGARNRLRVIVAGLRLFFRLWWGGGKLGPVGAFLHSRDYRSQLLLGTCRGLVFLPSMPHTYNQTPWVVEIEDPATLFHPHIPNGGTFALAVDESPYFPIVKTLLESRQCKGILTHMHSTARMVQTLFDSETISRKVYYTPLGIGLPERWQRHDDTEDDEIDLVFTTSWHQQLSGFIVRGGLDMLEAFATLRERYPQLRLTVRARLPDLDPHFHRILEGGSVRLIQRFMQADEMERLLAQSHIFVLPAARVHIVSVLQAMGHGLAVVASDGWGMEEYITHERNGLIVPGRYGKTSWTDEEAGFLREDYQPLYTTDPDVVAGLVEAISRLVEDRALRRQLGRNARADVANTYNLENWNRGLKEALDQALESR